MKRAIVRRPALQELERPERVKELAEHPQAKVFELEKKSERRKPRLRSSSAIDTSSTPLAMRSAVLDRCSSRIRSLTYKMRRIAQALVNSRSSDSCKVRTRFVTPPTGPTRHRISRFRTRCSASSWFRPRSPGRWTGAAICGVANEGSCQTSISVSPGPRRRARSSYTGRVFEIIANSSFRRGARITSDDTAIDLVELRGPAASGCEHI